MIRQGAVEDIIEVIKKIPEFENPYNEIEFRKRLDQNKSLILIYESEGEVRGFKCGYERYGINNSFYSWMGGVVPQFRNRQIAKKLLHEMEDWCRNKKYQFLTLKTLNRHKAMLIFSIKNSFEITRVEDSPKDGEKRIWLSKKIIKCHHKNLIATRLLNQ